PAPSGGAALSALDRLKATAAAMAPSEPTWEAARAAAGPDKAQEVLTALERLQRTLDQQQAEQQAMIAQLTGRWEERFAAVLQCLQKTTATTAVMKDRSADYVRLSEVLESSLDESLLKRPLDSMYSHLRRRFRIGGAVGQEFVSINGILQGCPLSVVLLNALVSVWCHAVNNEVPDAIVDAFADDTGASVDSWKSLQQVVGITESFADLTGQVLNAKKSVCYSTGRRKLKELRLKGLVLPQVKSWRCVGAVLYSVRRKRTKAPQQRIKAALKVADKIQWVPLPVSAKASLVGSSVLPRACFGSVVSALSKTQRRTLRTAVVRALWGKKRSRRCPEIVLTLFGHGHRIDPIQASPYLCLTSMQQVLCRRPELQDLFGKVWRRRRASSTALQPVGPCSCIAAAAKALGWKWVSPFEFRTDAGHRISVLEGSREEFQHIVRESARRMVWREAFARRTDMQGIEVGINREATGSLLRSTRLSAYEQGILRAILTGAVWTQERACRAKQSDSGCCSYCGSGAIEDHVHLWWECPAWSHVRTKHTLPEFSSYQDWPPCLRLCGLLPCDADEPEIREPAVDLTEDSARVVIDLTLDETSGNPDCTLACALWKDGRVIVFTDGACRDNQTPALRKAGVGAFWHTNHAMNISEPLLGHAQTNNRAELTAVIRVLQTDSRSLDIRTDSKYVHDGCVLHLPKWRANSWKSGSREISNKDLWLQLDCLLCRRPKRSILFTKVKGHSRDADVRAGRTSSLDKWGNDAADKLAVAGAQMHATPPSRRRHVLKCSILAQSVQHMMVDILIERALTAAAVAVQGLRGGFLPVPPREIRRFLWYREPWICGWATGGQLREDEADQLQQRLSSAEG
ncbi:unnamed protein product, partial [Polarella glacialis]